MPDQPTPRERAEAGARFLDAVADGWHTRVNLLDIDVASATNDVFFQATGFTVPMVSDWIWTDAAPGIDGYIALGLWLEEDEDPAALGEVWVDLIAERLYPAIVGVIDTTAVEMLTDVD